MDTIKRIQKMENHLNQGETSLDRLNQELDQLEELLPDLQTLFAYYQSPVWTQDLDLDEKGQLPKNLSRGVLSEDAIYNLLASYVATADRLAELSHDMEQKLQELKKD